MEILPKPDMFINSLVVGDRVDTNITEKWRSKKYIGIQYLYKAGRTKTRDFSIFQNI